MTFIDQPDERSAKKDAGSKNNNKAVQKNVSPVPGHGSQENVTDAGETGQKHEKDIGLVGGQPKEDKGGLDISQYTGPGSKPSATFDDPQAPYHTGPGSGLSADEEAAEAERENPEYKSIVDRSEGDDTITKVKD